MAGTPIGRILLMPKGDYSGSAVYDALDWVRWSGSSWVCTTDNTTGIAPAVGVPEWQLLAADGTVGGWSTLANKPFETIGKGLTVPSSGAEQDQLKINVDTTMLLGSKLGVNVQNTYSASDVNPISGTGVSQAISSKADDTDLDEWVKTTPDTTVNNSHQFEFTVDTTNDVGYIPWFNITASSTNKSPSATIHTLNDSIPASTYILYDTDADIGTVVRLRKVK